MQDPREHHPPPSLVGTITLAIGLACVAAGAVWLFWGLASQPVPDPAKGIGTGPFIYMEELLAIALALVGIGTMFGGLAARAGTKGWWGFIVAPIVVSIAAIVFLVSLARAGL